jgi:hypothetical protein
MREAGVVDRFTGRSVAELGIARGDLLYCDNDLHDLKTDAPRRGAAWGAAWERFSDYSWKRLKIKQPLVPPNPKLLDSPYSIFIGRA